MTSERETKPTVAMRRDVLLGLVAQTAPDEREEELSVMAVLFVIALFAALFVAIIKVS